MILRTWYTDAWGSLHRRSQWDRVVWLRNSTLRLALLYWLIFSVSVAVLLGFIRWSTAGFAERHLDTVIETEVQGLAEHYRRFGTPAVVDVIRSRSNRAPQGAAVYLLTNRAFRPIVGNLNRWPSEHSIDGGWIEFNAQEVKGSVSHPVRAQVFSLPGGLRLLVGRDARSLTELRDRIDDALIGGLGMTLLLGIGGGLLLARSTARRLETINTTTRAIVDGDLSRRIPRSGNNDEYDRLIAHLNEMLDRIQSLMNDVRRISDNVAHDLRTPLTHLRQQLESLRASLPANNTPIDTAISESDRLLSMFNALLRIAHIESGRRRSAFTLVDLAAVVADAVDLYRPLVEDRAQQLEVTIPTVVMIFADADLLFQACTNLLDNAVKHTPPKGQIDLILKATNDTAVMQINDSGPGVNKDECQLVFNRFYRSESSRTTSGNGLGLSLVQAIANLHQGGTAADAGPGGRFRFWLPLRSMTNTDSTG